jgi:hypothetical protein
MRRLFILLILMAYQASATVEDLGGSIAGTGIAGTGSVWPGPSLPSLPTSPTCPSVPGCLIVTVDLTGPQLEQDKGYTAPGKTLAFTVSVKNEGPSEVEAELSISPEDCFADWFSWTTETLKIPAGVSRSESLQVRPDMNAVAGKYSFKIEASAKCSQPGATTASFRIQDYDYASETAISGTGQFQLNKDVRSMNSGIKSNKEVFLSGTVDALVKNEYLVDQAKGRNPNFEEQDAVDNYMALQPGDALFGTENFKSSAVFGGVGAKVTEAYNVQQMEFKSQNFNLHQTGTLKKTAEFKTADNFTGFYLIDAKQTIPGQKGLKEHEEYLGSFEINRRILFRNRPTFSTPTCFDSPSFTSPSLSSSCGNFVNNLNTFAKSA